MAQIKDQGMKKQANQRQNIANSQMKELNELVNKRKQLQLQAFRLTEMFKQHVDSMTVNKVKDIFAQQERDA